MDTDKTVVGDESSEENNKEKTACRANSKAEREEQKNSQQLRKSTSVEDECSPELKSTDKTSDSMLPRSLPQNMLLDSVQDVNVDILPEGSDNMISRLQATTCIPTLIATKSNWKKVLHDSFNKGLSMKNQICSSLNLPNSVKLHPQNQASGSIISTSTSQAHVPASHVPATDTRMSASFFHDPASASRILASAFKILASVSDVEASVPQIPSAASQILAPTSEILATASRIPTPVDQVPASAFQTHASMSQIATSVPQISAPVPLLHSPTHQVPVSNQFIMLPFQVPSLSPLSPESSSRLPASTLKTHSSTSHVFSSAPQIHVLPSIPATVSQVRAPSHQVPISLSSLPMSAIKVPASTSEIRPSSSQILAQDSQINTLTRRTHTPTSQIRLHSRHISVKSSHYYRPQFRTSTPNLRPSENSSTNFERISCSANVSQFPLSRHQNCTMPNPNHALNSPLRSTAPRLSALPFRFCAPSLQIPVTVSPDFSPTNQINTTISNISNNNKSRPVGSVSANSSQNRLHLHQTQNSDNTVQLRAKPFNAHSVNTRRNLVTKSNTKNHNFPYNIPKALKDWSNIPKYVPFYNIKNPPLHRKDVQNSSQLGTIHRCSNSRTNFSQGNLQLCIPGTSGSFQNFKCTLQDNAVSSSTSPTKNKRREEKKRTQESVQEFIQEEADDPLNHNPEDSDREGNFSD